ncbi:MAG: hypothetical protein ACP5OB_05030 [Candidatus Ratteibacteria bacterium]
MDRKIFFLILVFIIIFEFQYIYLPNRKKIKNLDKLIIQKEKQYIEFLDLCEKYKKTKGKKNENQIKYAPLKFSFFTYLNDLIEKTGIKTNIQDIKILPKEEIGRYILEKLEIDLNLITLEQTLSILSQIERTKGVYITYFEMKRDKNKPYLLNLSMGISCLKQK